MDKEYAAATYQFHLAGTAMGRALPIARLGSGIVSYISKQKARAVATPLG